MRDQKTETTRNLCLLAGSPIGILELGYNITFSFMSSNPKFTAFPKYTWHYYTNTSNMIITGQIFLTIQTALMLSAAVRKHRSYGEGKQLPQALCNSERTMNSALFPLHLLH